MRAWLASPVLMLVLTAAAAAQTPASSIRHPKSGPAPSMVPTGVPAPNAADAAKIAEVLAFEKEMEAAVVRGDVKALDRMLSADFIFTHGDGWTPSPCVKMKSGDSMGSSALTSPRTTAASMSFSNASTSAIFAASAALGAGTPVGTTLGAGLVFRMTNWRRWPLRSGGRGQGEHVHESGPPFFASHSVRIEDERDGTRAITRGRRGGSPRPIRSRHSSTTPGQPRDIRRAP